PRPPGCFTISGGWARDIANWPVLPRIIRGAGGERKARMVGTAAAAVDEAGLGALDRLLAATATEMEKVNALILSRADSHVEMVPELARYLIEAGGKRLRPMLTVAAALLFGHPTGAQTNYAAAVEFMHNATLLHDDVVDESDMRRGKAAARI